MRPGPERSRISPVASPGVDVWAPHTDWPLCPETADGERPTRPYTARSESGIVFTIGDDPGDGSRCPARRDLWNQGCMMLAGHDCPHLPYDDSLAETEGPAVIVSLTR